MADNDLSGIHLGFFSKSLKDDPHPLALIGIDGREAISELFSFDLLLYRRGEPLEDEQLAALVSDPCVVAVGIKKTDIIHGVLSSISHVGGFRNRGSYYHAKLVPFVSLLDRGRRSAIYQATKVPAMIEQVLQSYGLSKDKNFFIKVGQQAKSPEHEYIVQFNESDWHFIQRWLEREGFFYWFRHTEKGVTLIISDSNGDATPLDKPTTLSHRDRNNLGDDDADTVWGMKVKHSRVPSSVTIVDYNDQRPLDILVSSEPVDKGGFGQVYHYGEHFTDTTLGAEWAKVRSQELYAQRRIITGLTDCARMRCGHQFEIEGHYFPPYDGTYLVTQVEHHGGIDARRERDDFTTLGDPRAYQAKFTAIPLKVPFRPQRRTAWPRIDGVISAHIEADTAGDFAQIDDQGRYHVKFAFDVGAKKGTAASRWIRMAQSYAGASYGQHLPLHKGTEILIAHIEGDPDRPHIVGAIPNPVTPSPVVSANATQSVLQTASGMRVELEDRA